MQANLKAQCANSLKDNQLAPGESRLGERQHSPRPSPYNPTLGEYTGDLRRYMNAPVKWDLGAEVRMSTLAINADT